MKDSSRFEVFPERDQWGEATGFWRWRLRAGNNQIVAQSEAYTRKEDAKRGVSDAVEAVRVATYGQRFPEEIESGAVEVER